MPGRGRRTVGFQHAALLLPSAIPQGWSIRCFLHTPTAASKSLLPMNRCSTACADSPPCSTHAPGDVACLLHEIGHLLLLQCSSMGVGLSPSCLCIRAYVLHSSGIPVLALSVRVAPDVLHVPARNIEQPAVCCPNKSRPKHFEEGPCETDGARRGAW
jgi:hypothetical protein